MMGNSIRERINKSLQITKLHSYNKSIEKTIAITLKSSIKTSLKFQKIKAALRSDSNQLLNSIKPTPHNLQKNLPSKLISNLK